MKIYFLGICGTAMGNAAIMLHKQGHIVCGADTHIYPPMSTFLESHGISLYNGYDAHRLLKIQPDLVVVGNALSRGNPEVEFLLETRAFAYTSLPALLNQNILKSRKNIVITGTHGKTTTTALSAFLLKANGQDPGYFIGGVPKDFYTGAHHGAESAPFVIEGDEYDSAFFDKRSKFIHYQPFILGINNIEFDHADIFHDLKDIIRTFNHVTRLVPQSGYIVLNGDDPNTASLNSIQWAHTLSIGLSPNNCVHIHHFQETQSSSSFELYYKGIFWDKIEWHHHGLFNARNAAMAATVVALALCPDNPTALDISSLKHFQGVKRRQEILHQCPKYIVMEDFGHHPSALEQTLHALRNRYPAHKLNVCFQASSNTAQSSIFQESFTQSLSRADAIFIAPLQKEKPNPLHTQKIAQDLQSLGLVAAAFDCNQTLLQSLQHTLSYAGPHPQLICFFSNSSFGGIIPSFLKSLV